MNAQNEYRKRSLIISGNKFVKAEILELDDKPQTNKQTWITFNSILVTI